MNREIALKNQEVANTMTSQIYLYLISIGTTQ
jgi:hypothetical protein